jgi:hypothetical protein
MDLPTHQDLEPERRAHGRHTAVLDVDDRA